MRISATALTLAGASIAASTGCSGEVADARPQWVVTVSTDAPVPQFGDRLFVEVLDSEGVACTACRRQFDAADPAKWPTSFGIVPEGGERRVRVRLFRSSLIDQDGTPAGSQLIDSLFTLPQVEGLQGVHVALSTRCFGVPAEVAERRSCDPATGLLAPEPVAAAAGDGELAAGTWPPDQAVPCEGDAPPLMACVVGGAFILGDAVAPPIVATHLQPTPERVVQISPFWLDSTELTVGAYKALRQQHPQLAEPGLRYQAGIQDSEHCTYDPLDSSRDERPLNCLTAQLAAELCALQDKRLPTEAEWEFAAGNGSAESPYGWGHSDDICAHAIVARGGTSAPSKCQIDPSGTLDSGPTDVGTSQDVTEAGHWDLSGNVAEWVADPFAAYDSPCWQGPVPLVDPQCNDGSAPERALRGGHWSSLPIEARVTFRHSSIALAHDPRFGLRCARSAQPR